MNHTAQTTFASALADQMVKRRFGETHGADTLESYFDFADRRQTVHLEAGQAERVIAITGRQRRKIKLSLEGNGTIIARMPMNDPRRNGTTIWAEVELGCLLDLLEGGADGAWCLNYASKADRRGYVKITSPIRNKATATNITAGRLIAGAGKGHIVRFHDKNPLNLRRDNLFIVGSVGGVEGQPKGAKHDAREVMQNRSRLRQSLAGSNYGPKAAGDR